jgi:hypothetical protein
MKILRDFLVLPMYTAVVRAGNYDFSFVEVSEHYLSKAPLNGFMSVNGIKFDKPQITLSYLPWVMFV